VNAAKDATELVAKLRAYHHTAQIKADKQHLSRYCETLNILLVYLITYLAVSLPTLPLLSVFFFGNNYFFP